MNLAWSHAVLYVRDMERMLAYYKDVLGFAVTDRGPLGDERSPEIVFLSQDPDEHHQLAMIAVRKAEGPSNSVNHFAFRTDSFDRLKTLYARLKESQDNTVNPLSHGNTLSLYFNDPEGNGIEVFWDTPWHVAQPQGKAWDPELDQAAALAWVKNEFETAPTFEPREAYYTRRHNAAQDAAE